MRQQTSINPLILNFLQPKKMEVISEQETKVVYDPKNHISMFLGGGNTGGRGTTSQKGNRNTRVVSGSGSSFWYENDAPVITDD